MAEGQKRRHDDAFESTITGDVKRMHRKLSHDSYTIGWIAALSLEVTAAEAMFDEHHQSLLNSPNDTNAYSLGSICGHNVVLTCLPQGCYGTTAAAAIATRMILTFPAIKIYLMVGIGGGVPSEKHDIRLGDVVVSIPRPDFPAVVQYDFGKTEAGGISKPKGLLNKPPSWILAANNMLQSHHQSGKSQMKAYIRCALEDTRPGKIDFTAPSYAQDILNEIECEHITEDSSCDSCDICGPPGVVSRAVRPDSTPMIHCGTIGSGNQVIKHGRTRDRLAQPYDILCFEMEAAGLMDHVPCLVIRGICDYCDTKKNKAFQNYAALTAAAYSKELLSVAPIQAVVDKLEPIPPTSATFNTEQERAKHHSSMIAALDYDEADSRRDTVRKAHPQTCSWLPQDPKYVEWLDSTKIENHHGLMWIRGKPGTGKSTLMKYTYEHAENLKIEDSIIVSFFFHARGGELEKSSIGMYRSILSQLFKKCPKLRTILDEYSSAQSEAWKIATLENMMRQAVDRLGSAKMFFFVDALDECPEEQMRKMLIFLEELCRTAMESGVYLRIGLSSRHYPHVSITAGIEFTLEEQDGHQRDLEKYIATELKIGKSRKADLIRIEILEKSRRIFLWVVLVIEILKTEYDRGRVLALRQRLDVIPLELDELFMDILKRNNRNLEELVLCMQWILFAKRPMRREEFYFALLAESQELLPWDSTDITTQIMDRFILDCSKGLAETTRAKNPTVQFIHESVREFLSKEGTLDQLWSGFRDVAPFTSHKKLRDSCNRYLGLVKQPDITDLEKQKLAPAAMSEKVHKLFPFLGYAVEQGLFHAEEMEMLQPSQTRFIATFNVDAWIRLYNTVQRFQVRRYGSQTSLSYIFAKLGLSNLLALALRISITLTSASPRFELLVSLALDDKDDKKLTAFRTLAKIRDNKVVSFDEEDVPFTIMFEYLQAMKNPKTGALFHPDSIDNSLSAIMRLLQCWTTKNQELLNTVFLDAVILRHEETVTFLLNHGAKIQATNDSEDTALHLVALHRHLPKRRSKNYPDQTEEDSVRSMISLLVDYGANINATNQDGATPLHIAIRNSTIGVVDFLMEKGASILSNEPIHKTACHVAIQAGNTVIARRLMDFWGLNDSQRDIIVEVLTDNASQQMSRTRLTAAIKANMIKLVKSLLDIGVSCESDDTDNIALHLAVQQDNVDMVRLFTDQLTSLETMDGAHRTPLLLAARAGSTNIVELLVEKGAALEARNSVGRTPLHSAVCNRHVDTAMLLLNRGAKAQSTDYHSTTILHDAAVTSDAAFVEALIDHGADMDIKDASAWTPLHHAAHYQNIEVVELMIKRGANAILPQEIMYESKWSRIAACLCAYVLARELPNR